MDEENNKVETAVVPVQPEPKAQSKIDTMKQVAVEEVAKLEAEAKQVINTAEAEMQSIKGVLQEEVIQLETAANQVIQVVEEEVKLAEEVAKLDLQKAEEAVHNLVEHIEHSLQGHSTSHNDGSLTSGE